MAYDEKMKSVVDDKGYIELRSQKMRNMVGQIPPFLICWGNTILLVVFILLVVVVSFFYLAAFEIP